MEFETLKKSHLKRNIIVGVVVVAIISAVILNFTRAKYRVTESIPLVNGMINYSLPDLNIIGLYIDGIEATELDSSKTYILDTTQSTCTYKDGTEISNLVISYDSETGRLSISPFTTKGTKCTLHFNEQKILLVDAILDEKELKIRTDFSTPLSINTDGVLYYDTTTRGTTYYYAGDTNENWVKFGGFYWRIIRINEDGTIRLIYSGSEESGPITQGADTQIGTSTFNSIDNNNMYVGYMYQDEQVHGLQNDSTIKEILDEWYRNNLVDYTNDIDGSAGFCGDRTSFINSSGTSNGGGTGTTQTYYSGYIKLYNAEHPNLDCSNEDLYTTSDSISGNKALDYPIGLISIDEVIYAGGAPGPDNDKYYLYTGQSYWTMSPMLFSGNAYIIVVHSYGYLGDQINCMAHYVYGVRPVINLKADVIISSGDGTASNSYVVV